MVRDKINEERYKNIVRIHENMVAYYTNAICLVLGIDPTKSVQAALYHDHGKLTWPKSLFTKSYKDFTDKDIEIIHSHPIVASEVIFQEIPMEKYSFISGDPSIIDIISLHHERPDGKGYYGETDLPIESVIVSICDVYDACLSDRTYRAGLRINVSVQEALKNYEWYLTKKHYDVNAVRQTLLDSAVVLKINNFTNMLGESKNAEKSI